MSRELGDGALFVFYVGPSYSIILYLERVTGQKTEKYGTQRCRKKQAKEEDRIQETGDRRQKKSPILDTGFRILDAGHPWKKRTKGLKEFSLAEPQ